MSFTEKDGIRDQKKMQGTLKVKIVNVQRI